MYNRIGSIVKFLTVHLYSIADRYIVLKYCIFDYIPNHIIFPNINIQYTYCKYKDNKLYFFMNGA